MKLLGRWAAALPTALATTLSAIALAGELPVPAPEPEPASAFVPRAVERLVAPRSAFPMRAEPEYGDGLGAGRGHEGQDLFAAAGTPLIAVANAVVAESGSDGGRGNFISIYDRTVQRTYSYFHMLAPPAAAAGDRVRAGEKLGELGCSGSCWGDHLHFEVRSGSDPWGPVIDPVPVLERLRAAETR